MIPRRTQQKCIQTNWKKNVCLEFYTQFCLPACNSIMIHLLSIWNITKTKICDTPNENKTRKDISDRTFSHSNIFFKPTYQVRTSEEQWISCIDYLNYNVTKWRHTNKFFLFRYCTSFLSQVSSIEKVLCSQYFYLLSMTLHSCLQNSRFLSYGVRINFCSSSSLDMTLD